MNIGQTTRVDTLNQSSLPQSSYGPTGNIQTGYGPTTGYDSTMYTSNVPGTIGYRRTIYEGSLGKNLYG